MQIYTEQQFFQEFITMQGWCVWEAEYNKEYDAYKFLAQYVGISDRYDRTTSYDVLVYRKKDNNEVIVMPQMR